MYLKQINHIKLVLFVSVLFVTSSCSLDVTDPNTATDEEVLTSREGITTLATGMQGYFKTTALQAIIRTPAVSTREMAVNTTFANLIDLENGGNSLPQENGNVLQLWSRLLQVVNMADQIIDNVDDVPLAPDEVSEILALAHIYKAMALGFLVSNFEQSPISTDEEGNAEFLNRDAVLAEAIDLLEEAELTISETSPANSVRTEGFEIDNTIQALLARYNLMAENYEEAITAADNVDPDVSSVFLYDGSTTRNPIYDDVFTSEDFIARDSLGSALAEVGDERIAFFLIEEDTLSTPHNLESAILDGFYSSASTAIPVYRPGEMNLIRAEAYARTDQPDNAVDEIDVVRTKQASEDVFELGANLPEYSGATDESSLIEEIFRQRSAELYLTGMRFEDARRLDRPEVPSDPPLSAERNRNYYPYPTQERQGNPNTPNNPQI